MTEIEKLNEEIAQLDIQINRLESKRIALCASRQPLLDALAMSKAKYKVGDRIEKKYGWHDKSHKIEITRVVASPWDSTGTCGYPDYYGRVVKKDGSVGKEKKVWPS